MRTGRPVFLKPVLRRRENLSGRKIQISGTGSNAVPEKVYGKKSIDNLEGRVSMSVDLGIDLGTASVLVYV